MEYTTNLNLKKPEGTNPAAVSDLNDNMDTLDAAIPNVVYSANAPGSPVTGMIWLKPLS